MNIASVQKRALAFLLALLMMASLPMTAFADQQEQSVGDAPAQEESLDAAPASEPPAPADEQEAETVPDPQGSSPSVSVDEEIAPQDEEEAAEEEVDGDEAPSPELPEFTPPETLSDIDHISKPPLYSPLFPGTVTVASVDPSASAVVRGRPITFTARVVSSADYYLYYRLYNSANAVVSEGLVTGTSVTVTPTVLDTYRVEMVAWNNDTSAWESSAISHGVVVCASPFAFTSVGVNATAISLGSPIVFTANVTGGSGNCSYNYNIYKNGSLDKASGTTTTNTYSYTPTDVGTYYCSVTVTDNLFGTTVTHSSPNVRVNAPLAIDSVTPAVVLSTVGTAVPITVKVSGGAGSYRFYYQLQRNGVDNDIKTGQTNNVYTLNPTLAGDYRLYVSVSDSLGTSAGSWSSVIKVIDTLKVNSVIPNVTMTETGSPIVFTASYTGGPPTSFTWVVYRGGEVAYNTSSVMDTLTYTPTASGTYSAKATAYYESGTLKLESSATSSSVTVQDKLTFHGVSVSSNMIWRGQSVTFTAETTGGAKVKDYVYRVWRVGQPTPEFVQNSNSASFTYTPLIIDDYFCEVSVKDAEHSTYVGPIASVPVKVLAPVTFETINVDSTKIPLGSNVTFTPVISGGSGSYEFIYCMFDSQRQLTMDRTTATSYTYTPPHAGNFYCEVRADDGTGNWIVVKSTTIQVVNTVSNVWGTLSGMQIYKNRPLTITGHANGGVQLFSFRVYDGSSNLVAESFTGTKLVFTPKDAGHYSVEIQAYDGIKWTAAPVYNFDVYEPFVYTHVNLSRTSAAVGDTIYMAPSVSGGIPTPEYIYCVYNGNTQLTMHQTTATNWSYTFTQPGTYRVSIYAVDGSGQWQVRSYNGIRVTSVAPLAITNISVSSTNVPIGTPITYNVSTTGGASQYIYCVFRNGTQVTMDYSTSPVYSYTPTAGGSYQITVYATDGSSWVHSTASTVTNVPSGGVLTINSIVTTPLTANIHDTLTYTTTVTGNVGAVTYIYCVFKDGVQQTMDYSYSNVYSYVVPAAGSYRIDVYATDSRNVWTKATGPNIINVAPAPPLAVNPTLSATTLTAPDYVTVSANASGGVAPYSYIYCLFKNGIQQTMDNSTALTSTYYLDSPGTYRIDVYCNDAAGAWAMKSSATITVN